MLWAGFAITCIVNIICYYLTLVIMMIRYSNSCSSTKVTTGRNLGADIDGNNGREGENERQVCKRGTERARATDWVVEQ